MAVCSRGIDTAISISTAIHRNSDSGHTQRRKADGRDSGNHGSSRNTSRTSGSSDAPARRSATTALAAATASSSTGTDTGRIARRTPAAPVNPNVAVDSHAAAPAPSAPAIVAARLMAPVSTAIQLQPAVSEHQAQLRVFRHFVDGSFRHAPRVHHDMGDAELSEASQGAIVRKPLQLWDVRIQARRLEPRITVHDRLPEPRRAEHERRVVVERRRRIERHRHHHRIVAGRSQHVVQPGNAFVACIPERCAECFTVGRDGEENGRRSHGAAAKPAHQPCQPESCENRDGRQNDLAEPDDAANQRQRRKQPVQPVVERQRRTKRQRERGQAYRQDHARPPIGERDPGAERQHRQQQPHDSGKECVALEEAAAPPAEVQAARRREIVGPFRGVFRRLLERAAQSHLAAGEDVGNEHRRQDDRGDRGREERPRDKGNEAAAHELAGARGGGRDQRDGGEEHHVGAGERLQHEPAGELQPILRLCSDDEAIEREERRREELEMQVLHLRQPGQRERVEGQQRAAQHTGRAAARPGGDHQRGRPPGECETGHEHEVVDQDR